MYYVETRANNSGYANHRVICLVVIGSSFDSEKVFQVSIIITLKKKLELIEHELCINNSGEPLALDSMQISIQ
jgi:hypothetical protein